MPGERKDYGKVSLPRELIKRIEKFIDDNPEYGYTSTAEFVKHAVNEKMDRHTGH